MSASNSETSIGTIPTIKIFPEIFPKWMSKKFIVIIGSSGAGKDTFAELIKMRYIEAGISAEIKKIHHRLKISYKY